MDTEPTQTRNPWDVEPLRHGTPSDIGNFKREALGHGTPSDTEPLGHGTPSDTEPLGHGNPSDTEPLGHRNLRQEALGHGTSQTQNPSDMEPPQTQNPSDTGTPWTRNPSDTGTLDRKPLDKGTPQTLEPSTGSSWTRNPSNSAASQGPSRPPAQPHLVLVPAVQLPLQDHSGSLPLPHLQEHGGCGRKQRPQGRVPLYVWCSAGLRSAQLTPQRHEDGEQHGALVVEEVGELEGGARGAGAAFPSPPAQASPSLGGPAGPASPGPAAAGPPAPCKPWHRRRCLRAAGTCGYGRHEGTCRCRGPCRSPC